VLCHLGWLLHFQPKTDEIQVIGSVSVMGNLPASHVTLNCVVHFSVFCWRRRK